MTKRPAVTRVCALAATSALALAGALPLASAATAAEQPCVISNDIDYSGMADTVVGLPTASGSRGAADVQLHGHGLARLYTRSNFYPGGVPTPGDRFGAAVALGNVDADRCTDVVIGAPG